MIFFVLLLQAAHWSFFIDFFYKDHSSYFFLVLTGLEKRCKLHILPFLFVAWAAFLFLFLLFCLFGLMFLYCVF